MGVLGEADQNQPAALREMSEDEIVTIFEKLDLPLVPAPQIAGEVKPLILFHVSGDSR